jgi:hypothetical protein
MWVVAVNSARAGRGHHMPVWLGRTQQCACRCLVGRCNVWVGASRASPWHDVPASTQKHKGRDSKGGLHGRSRRLPLMMVDRSGRDDSGNRRRSDIGL